ncbi:Abi family protein [Lysinibacillus pakistanensis]|uniref:Abi family protein n=1 Tax=Lysinibacillus pakistanensis TaxID=759811 RepID=UPI003D2879D3
MEKPFLDVFKQIEVLESRGLIIESKASAVQQLLQTSYYDLINGYKMLFLSDNKSSENGERFIEGTKIDDLINLYQLDRELRHIIMKTSLDIECNFYTTLAYCIALKYGEKESDYLKFSNYKNTKGKERKKFFDIVEGKLAFSQHPALVHYREKYGNIPPWILVKDLSFGNFIAWYKLCDQDIKERVISLMTGLTPTEEVKERFIKSLEIFNTFRNRAAHGGLIYNFKTRAELPFIKDRHTIFDIGKGKYRQDIGRSDIASFNIALYFLYSEKKSLLIENLVYLNGALNKYQVNTPDYYEKVLTIMGFPHDYNKRIHEFIGISYDG